MPLARRVVLTSTICKSYKYSLIIICWVGDAARLQLPALQFKFNFTGDRIGIVKLKGAACEKPSKIAPAQGKNWEIRLPGLGRCSQTFMAGVELCPPKGKSQPVGSPTQRGHHRRASERSLARFAAHQEFDSHSPRPLRTNGPDLMAAGKFSRTTLYQRGDVMPAY